MDRNLREDLALLRAMTMQAALGEGDLVAIADQVERNVARAMKVVGGRRELGKRKNG